MTIDEIMSALDAWVELHGDGTYIADDFHFEASYDHAIQQNRKEIKAFADVLLGLSTRNVILEIGLGNYGGTHMLWRLLFGKVITVEKHPAVSKVFAFRERPDQRSVILEADARDDATPLRVMDAAGRLLDALFIDAEHSYHGVCVDWINYSPLVRSGGIVAFHDSACEHPDYGVKRFLKQLAAGHIDGKKHRINEIVHCPVTGIAWEVVP